MDELKVIWLFLQGNILIDDNGRAIITDFGLSKVMEELSGSLNRHTSFFAGSARWMAPELMSSLVRDDSRAPPITTSSDVYAFSCVCLEVCNFFSRRRLFIDTLEGCNWRGTLCTPPL
jgi:serine/threonine protein kinase